MFHVPEKNRVKYHPVYGKMDSSLGNNGVFEFSYRGYQVFCIASNGMGWEHVSVTIDRNRCAGWDVMCHIKDLFWDEEDTVIQFHPPKSKYVNNNQYCLHLWKQIGKTIELPETILTGIIHKNS